MSWVGETPITFRGRKISENNYNVELMWQELDEIWIPGGDWVIGNRPSQPVVSVHAVSKDGGRSFKGTMAYLGEEPIGLRLLIEGGI